MKRQNTTQTVMDVVEAEDKLIDKSENLLTFLFRKILLELSIGPKVFTVLINDYLDNPHNGIGNKPKDRYNHRGNLIKELGGNSMTFNLFMKALKVFGAIDVEFVVRLRRRNKRTGEFVTTEHSIYVPNLPEDPAKNEDLSKAKIVEGLQTKLDRPPLVLQESKVEVEPPKSLVSSLIRKAKDIIGTK